MKKQQKITVEKPKAASSLPRLSVKKRIAFYAIALSIPIVLLLLIELSLRLSGYGQSYPLFIESQRLEGYLEPNPEVIKRFFYPRTSAPQVSPDTYLFKAEKPKNTLRIVTMGGSTMAGFPYGRFGSPGGMLQQRIRASFPERDIEVISVAMSSINSFSLLDFVDEVSTISPDAVLIYAGHNEYLGVMGVGSSFAGLGSYSSNLVFLRIKEWRIFQVLQALYHSVFKPEQAVEQDTNDRTLMAQIAKEKDIPYQSELFEAGKAQFENNLGMILAQFAASKLPVFVATLASNEKDQAPFNSVTDAYLGRLAKGLQNNTVSQRDIQLALQRNAEVFHADFSYAFAKHKLRMNQNIEDTRLHFQAARDFDLLRFRAPSEFNDIIVKLSQQHGAKLVDVEARLREQSDKGIIGKDLMLEHLHPNLLGYFWMAEAFFQALIEHGTLPSPSNKVSSEQAWTWQNVSKLDQSYADFKIAQLTSDYPFTDTPQSITLQRKDFKHLSAEEYALLNKRIQGESFVKLTQVLVEELQKQGRFLEAGLSAGVLFEALPTQAHLARIASLLLLRDGALPLAEYYARKASYLKPRETNFKLSLAEILFKQGKKAEAISKLDEVIAQDPNNIKAKQIKRAIQ